MSQDTEASRPVSPRADLLSALVWTAFGAAVLVASWNMDRLENLHINRYEVPGLVPGLLGLAITVLGVLLALRSIARGALRPAGAPRPTAPGGRAYMLAVLCAMLFYPLVLVGRGLPFWLVTAGFVAAFIFVFDRARQQALGRGPGRQVLLALVYGAATSAVVSFAFQQVFYVRLP